MSTKVHKEKIRSKTTKDRKGSGFFAMEDIEKDEYVQTMWGKLNTKEGRKIT